MQVNYKKEFFSSGIDDIDESYLTLTVSDIIFVRGIYTYIPFSTEPEAYEWLSDHNYIRV